MIVSYLALGQCYLTPLNRRHRVKLSVPFEAQELLFSGILFVVNVRETLCDVYKA